GTVTQGNANGDTQVAVNIGTIPPNASVIVSYRVVVNANAANAVANQALVNFTNPISTGTGAAQIRSDDPDTSTDQDPTATPIIAPTALENRAEPARQNNALFLPMIKR